jgi:DNA-binding MarR family transcriptional regulator
VVNSTTPPPDDDAPWLSDEQRESWMTMVGMLMTLPTAIDAQLKRDAGLNFFEYSILASLSRPPGRPVRMNMLALFAGGSASRLSHAVGRLERQGWVRRIVNTGEPRCIEAVLTDAGMAVLEAAAPGHVREARRLVIDVLTPEQLRQLRTISRQLMSVSHPHVGAAVEAAILEAATDSTILRDALDTACAAAEQAAAEGRTPAIPHPADSPATGLRPDGGPAVGLCPDGGPAVGTRADGGPAVGTRADGGSVGGARPDGGLAGGNRADGGLAGSNRADGGLAGGAVFDESASADSPDFGGCFETSTEDAPVEADRVEPAR